MWYLTPHQYVGLAWLALAWPLLEIGLLGAWSECLSQAYVLGNLAAFAILSSAEFGLGVTGAFHPSRTLAAAALLTAAAAVRLFVVRRVNSSAQSVQAHVRDWCAFASVVFLALLAWHQLPAPVVALAWGALALMLVEIGLAVDWPCLAEQGHALAALTFGRLFLAEFAALGHVLELSDRLITVLATVPLFYYLSWRLRPQRRTASEHHARLARVYLWMAAIVVTVGLGLVVHALGWGWFGKYAGDALYACLVYLLMAAAAT